MGALLVLKKNQFLFEELVKRDFKQKYKRTVFGMAWSVLSPLMQLFVMRVVFMNFFGRSMEHYTTYLFCGNLVYSYFSEATHGGMHSLMANAGIFTKVNVPKYLFLLSRNFSSLINFALTLLVFFIFVAVDGVSFSLKYLALVYPVICLLVFNIGAGLILSALFVFFRDVSYLYDIFTQLLMYMSAIFYSIESYAPRVQRIFLLNPIYCYIKYFRLIVLEGDIPSLRYHLLCAFYALFLLGIGVFFYKKYNHRFLYYV